MAFPGLDPELARQTLALVAKHGGKVNIAGREAGVPQSTFRTRYERACLMFGTPTPPPAPVVSEPDTVREPLHSFEEAWQQWRKAIGMAKDRYVQPKARSSGQQKVLVVPDLHAPFHEPEMFAAMLEAEKDADVCICIGDMGDSYALSRFTKYERMPYRDEWASVTLVMQELASRFPKVVVVIGNHDARLERQIRDRLTEDMVDAIRFITGGILCPITALAKRYPNVEIAHHETPSGHAIDWFTTIGDAWLGHPEKYSRVAGAALRFTEEWIADNEHALGLDRYRLIVMGHTHAMSWFPYRADKLLVECGCLCLQQGYMMSPRIGGRPQRRGYTTFVQYHGVTDLNSVRCRWLDVEKVA